ncbi:ribosome-recycling factor, putative [Plasmodium malariae]|uniref:Ribosome-recycling factor, putative n=3 Tax=Plasmodium (Plasmodium) TaxID=418103 RepID=A0A1D3JLU5_PLAMA|nr:ribosome-recycling factor, putative [Plasmodium malariae]SBT87518.1 ribosome-recycling factor, putative [Plasmodium malariae]
MMNGILLKSVQVGKGQMMYLKKDGFFVLLQRINFGSKKQKEKIDKETKKIRNLLKISNIKNEEIEEQKNLYEKLKISGSEKQKKNIIDYKTYDIKIEQISKSFENKLKKIFDSTLTVEFFNNITVTKDKKDLKLSDVAQVVIKSSKLIQFFPYLTSDIQKIIHSLKLKVSSWNPITSNDGQYILLQISALTDDIKLKKKKEAKDLLEKIKNDIRSVRHKIRDNIEKYLEGNEWKIVERKKLDNYIKEKIKAIEWIYEKYTTNYS